MPRPFYGNNSLFPRKDEQIINDLWDIIRKHVETLDRFDIEEMEENIHQFRVIGHEDGNVYYKDDWVNDDGEFALAVAALLSLTGNITQIYHDQEHYNLVHPPAPLIHEDDDALGDLDSHPF